jgi:hypothetical protein
MARKATDLVVFGIRVIVRPGRLRADRTIKRLAGSEGPPLPRQLKELHMAHVTGRNIYVTSFQAILTKVGGVAALAAAGSDSKFDALWLRLRRGPQLDPNFGRVTLPAVTQVYYQSKDVARQFNKSVMEYVPPEIFHFLRHTLV